MATITQYTGLSCGAACLLAAALELDSDPDNTGLPPTGKLSILISNRAKPSTAQAPWLIEWQRGIYQVSGAGQAGYSLPSGVVEAARYMGMTGTVVLAKTFTAGVLKWQYPHEIATCLPFTENSTSSDIGDMALAANERAMHCVRIGPALGVHWILQRPDDTYMDPAGGKERANRGKIKSKGQSIFSYHGTGLAIRLSKP